MFIHLILDIQTIFDSPYISHLLHISPESKVNMNNIENQIDILIRPTIVKRFISYIYSLISEIKMDC